ncbi:cobaltochelatase subunit CobN [Deinococcus roseus]|uniref:Cobaltochelatase subunit CobN n=1 Tax=Deinococcus roseus TaxID=392414 RepID=A0ABQ2D2H4_9DEIO|nr:cobaltochelatase subunit CobN [Deinococcus roseus]GGJ42454.1 cobaltochelatase subunit CobN [Deinococcus roseus]
MSRSRVTRADGRTVQVIQRRGHLSYCFSGCCCGHVNRGYPPVPVDAFKNEWLRRKLRHTVHLTKAGCLGPCTLANVASLVFDGQSVWFHSVNSPEMVTLIFDHIEQMVTEDRFLAPPAELQEYVFQFYDWDARDLPVLPQANAEVRPAGMAFVSHADTDLLALRSAVQHVPELQVTPYAMPRGDQEATRALLSRVLKKHELVVLSLLSSQDFTEDLLDLKKQALAQGTHLLVLKGTFELGPDTLQASTVKAQMVQQVSRYLQAGGVQNCTEMLRFLGAEILDLPLQPALPEPLPELGIYHPEFLQVLTLPEWEQLQNGVRPVVAVVFYRAHFLSGNTAFVDALLQKLDDAGLCGKAIFTPSLKHPHLQSWLAGSNLIVSTLSFAAGEGVISLFQQLNVPVVQAITSASRKAAWTVSSRGLGALDTLMNVTLPEFDGRLMGDTVAFKEQERFEPFQEGISQLVQRIQKWLLLQQKPNFEKKVAFVLTNSGAKAAKVGNAVGLDAPRSLLNLLQAMRSQGYTLPELDFTPDDLIHQIILQGTYDGDVPVHSHTPLKVPKSVYQGWFEAFPEVPRQKMLKQWQLEKEPYSTQKDLLFSGLELGHAVICLQPPRGYGMDRDAIYHQPDLPPTHHYAAFYQWLTRPAAEGGWGADAIVHVGKHGTLEWLPGKGVGLSEACFPELLLNGVPLLYPFIVNDPGEGTQAKRRGHAVIVDHLMPPLTRADTYGNLAQLQQLIDQHYQLEATDPGKLPALQKDIWQLIEDTHLESDLDLQQFLTQDHGDHKHDWDETLNPDGIPVTLSEMGSFDLKHLLEDIDGYLCELGMLQIRDGLHVLGELHQLPDTLRALTRLSSFQQKSVSQVLALHFGLDWEELLQHKGKRFERKISLLDTEVFSHADALEVLDDLTLQLYQGLEATGFDPEQVKNVLQDTLQTQNSHLEAALCWVCNDVLPKLEGVDQEIWGVLRLLNGEFLSPGPSGAPSRGALHVLPTGRNFYAIDPKSVPAPTSWEVGMQLANATLQRYLKQEGRHPEMVGLSVWGTSNIRTHGDDIAQILAFLGVKPLWNPHTRKVEGLHIIPLAELGRPRIDVTVRISGFFRDAFPHVIDLLDEAFEKVMDLEEDPEQNFPRKHCLQSLQKDHPEQSPEQQEMQARYRIFGAKPESYGAGILPLIEEGNWQNEQDFLRAYLTWGGYAYSRSSMGEEAQQSFQDCLEQIQVALHNQDNREHDLLDSDDYFQFHGGMVASIHALTGSRPKAYFGDSSNPDQAQVRDLKQEILRVYRARVINPKWLSGIQRHGYKGALEMLATVDYLFGFDATTGTIEDFMYQEVAQQYALDPDIQQFFKNSNPWALKNITERLLEAAERQLWENPDPETLQQLKNTLQNSENWLEEVQE